MIGVIEKVKSAMEKHGLAQNGGHIVAGVSGGPDSLCLLHVLFGLVSGWGMGLSAVHVNHGIRGEAADQDQAFTENFCTSLKIPVFVYKVDVPALSKEKGLSEEAAGRRVRYEAFEEQRQRLLAEGAAPVYIAVAQNKEDQAETVLMRILRGTGTDGLAGMEPVRDGYVIRPLLDVSREEIEEYCRGQGIVPCRDHTNQEALYTRNRIRLELLPWLREHYNENITEALVRLAAIAAEDKDCLYQAIKEVDSTEIPGGREVSRRILQGLHPALRKRVVLENFKRLGLLQDITALHLEPAERLITEGRTSAFLEFPGGYRMQAGYETVKFLRPEAGAGAGVGAESAATPRKAFSVREAEGPVKESVLTNEAFEALERAQGGIRKDQAFFDRDILSGRETIPLVCRTRRPGDFIRPKGMVGRKKLQDFFVDRKIPRGERDRLPLICLGSEVLWIPGCCISGTASLGPETKHILFLEFISDMW